MVVREMTGHSAEETIDKLSSIFAELGLPRTLHCNRGTNYTSSKISIKVQILRSHTALQNTIVLTMLREGFRQLNNS